MECDLRVRWRGGRPRLNFSELFALDRFHPRANWSFETVNQYRTELHLMRYLTNKCPQATDESVADVVVAGFPYGTWMTSGWGRARPRLQDPIPKVSEFNDSQIVVFFSVDEQFIAPLMTRPLFVTLGDDGITGRPHSKMKSRLRSISVPYRLDQWGLQYLATVPAWSSRRRLAVANVNGARHRGRLKVIQSCLAIPGCTANTHRQLDVHAAVHLALTTRFVLTPTGDSKGFCARFYFALLHGATPVFIDLWRRNLGFDELRLPFPSQLDWRKLIMYFPNEPDPQLLNTSLHGFQHDEAEAAKARRLLFKKMPQAFITELKRSIASSP